MNFNLRIHVPVLKLKLLNECRLLFSLHCFIIIFCSQFTDKLEDMLETLATTSEQVENAEPVSAHPDKLREQLMENKVNLWYNSPLQVCFPHFFFICICMYM